MKFHAAVSVSVSDCFAFSLPKITLVLTSDHQADRIASPWTTEIVTNSPCDRSGSTHVRPISHQSNSPPQYITGDLDGYGPLERKSVRTKAQQNEIPIERNPIRTTTRQKESPTERKAQFEPVYNRLFVETVFAASVNVTTET